MIEDHLEMAQENKSMSDEHDTDKTMRSLSVGDKQSSSSNAKVIPKRRRAPSPLRDDPLCSDSSIMSDAEFQLQLDKQTKRVNHEVTILRDMVEEDERRQQWRLEKRRRVDQRVDESLLFVAQLLKKDAEKGGVNETH